MTPNTASERGNSRPPPRRDQRPCRVAAGLAVAISPPVQTAVRAPKPEPLLVVGRQQTKPAAKLLNKIRRIGKTDRSRDIDCFFTSHQPPAGFVKSQILYKQRRRNAKRVGELVNEIIFRKRGPLGQFLQC